MANQFEHIATLPKADQDRLNTLLAKPVTARTAQEAAFLAARSAYANNMNEIITLDSVGRYLLASGSVLPTGYGNFRKGATFLLKGATGHGAYLNTGDETNSVWQLVTSS